MKEYTYEERHMGTDVVLSFVCSEKPVADAIAKQTFTTIRQYENIFSRFKENSELSLLNKNGMRIVSAEFIAVLKRSFELTKLTDNNFNPLVQVATLGYKDTYTSLVDKTTITSHTDTDYNTDTSLCHIDTATKAVTLGPNQQLDFGGILKGYLAALLADTVMSSSPTFIGCIINIGGDIATRGVDEFHEPFIFFLYNPITGSDIPVIIQNESLATSGTYKRRWKTSTGTQHHIVDSSTRDNPPEAIVAASIVSLDGALTEALTKLFITRGVSEALKIAPPHIHHYKYFTVLNSGEMNSTII